MIFFLREGGQHLALLVLSAHGLRKERTQLGVDACGVRGCIRSYRQVNLPMRHSFAHFCEGFATRKSSLMKDCFSILSSRL